MAPKFFFLFNIFIQFYFFRYESIEIHAHTFLTLLILAIGRVQRLINFSSIFDSFPLENDDVNYENPLTQRATFLQCHASATSYNQVKFSRTKTVKTVFYFANRNISFSNHQLSSSYLQLNQRTVTHGSHNIAGIFIKDVIFDTTYLNCLTIFTL